MAIYIGFNIPLTVLLPTDLTDVEYAHAVLHADQFVLKVWEKDDMDISGQVVRLPIRQKESVRWHEGKAKLSFEWMMADGDQKKAIKEASIYIKEYGVKTVLGTDPVVVDDAVIDTVLLPDPKEITEEMVKDALVVLIPNADEATIVKVVEQYMEDHPETDPTIAAWAKAKSKPSYTAKEVGALPATTTIPTNVSQLNNDSGYITRSYHDSSKQDTLTAGENIAIVDNVISATGGGSGGTSDYTELTNKPQINGKELSGNVSLSDIGAQSVLTDSDKQAIADLHTDSVESVNDHTGVVVLTAKDVGALPDSTVIPADMTSRVEAIETDVGTLKTTKAITVSASDWYYGSANARSKNTTLNLVDVIDFVIPIGTLDYTDITITDLKNVQIDCGGSSTGYMKIMENSEFATGFKLDSIYQSAFGTNIAVRCTAGFSSVVQPGAVMFWAQIGFTATKKALI